MAITDKGVLCVVNIEPLQKSYSNEREVTHVLRDITLYVCAGGASLRDGPAGLGHAIASRLLCSEAWVDAVQLRDLLGGVRLGRRCFFCCLFFQ